jgi:hypothetical protein
MRYDANALVHKMSIFGVACIEKVLSCCLLTS